MNAYTYQPQRVQRVPEETYSEMVRSTMASMQISERRAVAIVNRVLGPAMLAPPLNGALQQLSCGHAYWSEKGEWLPCHESGEHREHTDEAMTEAWRDGQARDVSVWEWEA